MKTTLRLSTFIVALVSVFTFSSCLNDDNASSNGAMNYYPVTIYGNNDFGYTFYADFCDSKLIPSMTNIMEVIPYLTTRNDIKRAFIAFDLASETENGKELVAGETYQIIVRNDFFRRNNFIPTYNTVMSTDTTDSLHTSNQRINYVDSNRIWAENGYVNAQLTINYYNDKNFDPFKLDLKAYYTEEDIDVANNTFNLNLYYNSNSEQTNSQGTSDFSFRLPEEVAHKFQGETINLVLNAITEYGSTTLTKVAECKMAVKDFYAPQF
jgi:hypothetical protein